MADVRLLETLLPSENGVTVFDAEAQETSYGICVFEGLLHIFDTHRKAGVHVATIELLTEVIIPIRISGPRIRGFCRDARARGLFPIPYSGCFFKRNLHVYSFSGPVRGFDLAAVGATVAESERKLVERVRGLWPRIPAAIIRAQKELVRGRRRVRHPADLEVLLRRLQEATGQGRSRRERRTL